MPARGNPSRARYRGREHAAVREQAYRPWRLPQTRPWPELFAESRRDAEINGPVASRPVVRVACELVLTGGMNRPDVLVVRCRCMAGTAAEPSRRFYRYDPLGTAATIGEALALWREHLAGGERETSTGGTVGAEVGADG